MFTVRNSADRTEIDIIGAIGEDWFDEGNSLENVRSQILASYDDLHVNISSLGGDLIEALAIYDMFKSHKGKVTTNIIGATASAGTVIALGGDSISISENSLFLGHKASTMANDLDKFDSRLIAIYKKKTGKTKAEIENWLKEDKWITAEEAKSFGLVDEIYKAKKVLNSAELDELSKIKQLPQNYYINMDNNKTAVDSFLAKLGLQTIKAEVSVETLAAENEALKAQLEASTAKVSELEANLVTEKETIIEASKVSIGEVESTLTNKAELQTTKVALAKALAGGVVIEANADPAPDGSENTQLQSNPFPLSEGSKGLFEQAKHYKENK
jgi:ATP-dependent Clp protease, protease subunit